MRNDKKKVVVIKSLTFAIDMTEFSDNPENPFSNFQIFKFIN